MSTDRYYHKDGSPCADGNCGRAHVAGIGAMSTDTDPPDLRAARETARKHLDWLAATEANPRTPEQEALLRDSEREPADTENPNHLIAVLAALDAERTRRGEAERRVEIEHRGCNRHTEALKKERDAARARVAELDAEIAALREPGECASIHKLQAMVNELRLELANERGAGSGPSEGWQSVIDNGFNLSWQKSGGPRGVIVVRRTLPFGWRYDFTFESGPERQTGSARDVMRAADAALAGGKS